MIQEKNMKTRQKTGRTLGTIGKIYRVFESCVLIVVFGFIFYDRFCNIAFLPHRLRSGKLYLCILVPSLILSLSQLLISGSGIILLIRNRLWLRGGHNSRMVLRFLFLMLFVVHILFVHLDCLASFDEIISDKYISFIINHCGANG